MHEAAGYARNSFITLTFDDEHLPLDQSIHRETWTAFRKALRKRIGPFRYFHCGEYGADSHTARPHYHAIIFGHDFHEDRTYWKTSRSGHKMYNSPTLDAAWQHKGFAVIGSVTHESAAYVAKYIMKKHNGDNELADERYATFDKDGVYLGQREREFTSMSLKPGLGSAWFEKYWRDVYPADFVLYRDAKGQYRKTKPPRYYDQLLQEKDRDIHDYVKDKRRQRAAENSRLELSDAIKDLDVLARSHAISEREMFRELA